MGPAMNKEDTTPVSIVPFKQQEIFTKGIFVGSGAGFLDGWLLAVVVMQYQRAEQKKKTAKEAFITLQLP